MRWLVVGAGATGALELVLVKALRRVGVDATLLRLDLPEAIAPTSLVRRVVRRASGPALFALRRRRVRAFFRTTTSRFDVVLVVKGLELTPALIAECRARTPGARWLNYNPDDPFNLASRGATSPDILASVGLFDVYLIWSQAIAERLRAYGAKRVAYLPFAFDPETHPPPRGEVPVTDVVSFVGAWDPAREATVEALVGRCNLRIHGGDWYRAAARVRERVVPTNLYGRALGDATASALVSLDILRPQNVGSHNMRTFEIPGMGGLLLTTRSAEQQGFFPEEEASFMFASPGELRHQVARILADGEHAARVRARGRELVQAHTYEARARDLVRLATEG